MYTSAVFLGKKNETKTKKWKNHYYDHHCYYHKRDVFYEKLPRPKNGYNKKSNLSFYKKVIMCNEDPNKFNLFLTSLQYQYNIKQTSDVNKEKYLLGNY